MDIGNFLGVGDIRVHLIPLLMALLCLGFGCWTYFRSKQRKLITYQLAYRNINAVSVDHDKGVRMKVFLNGQEVEEMRCQLIEIRNEGNVAVDDNDYEKPIQIAFMPQTVSCTSQSSQIILRAGIYEAAPSIGISSHNAKDHIILDAKNQYVALKNVLLNANDWIKIKVLTQGNVDIVVRGQIKDGQIKPIIPAQRFLLWQKVVSYVVQRWIAWKFAVSCRERKRPQQSLL